MPLLRDCFRAGVSRKICVLGELFQLFRTLSIRKNWLGTDCLTMEVVAAQGRAWCIGISVEIGAEKGLSLGERPGRGFCGATTAQWLSLESPSGSATRPRRGLAGYFRVRGTCFVAFVRQHGCRINRAWTCWRTALGECLLPWLPHTECAGYGFCRFSSLALSQREGGPKPSDPVGGHLYAGIRMRRLQERALGHHEKEHANSRSRAR
jgi:hypothetical protein